MNLQLAEKLGLKLAGLPADINGAGLVGERIEVAKGHRLSVVIACDAGAGEIVASLKQHDAASGGNSKALNIFQHVHVKKDAETSFTRTEIDPSVGVANFDAQVASKKGIIVIEILDTDLDVNNGFAYVSADIASPGANAKVVAVLYGVHEVKHGPAYLESL